MYQWNIWSLVLGVLVARMVVAVVREAKREQAHKQFRQV
jgi:hypothetical protein